MARGFLRQYAPAASPSIEDRPVCRLVSVRQLQRQYVLSRIGNAVPAPRIPAAAAALDRPKARSRQTGHRQRPPPFRCRYVSADDRRPHRRQPSRLVAGLRGALAPSRHRRARKPPAGKLVRGSRVSGATPCIALRTRSLSTMRAPGAAPICGASSSAMVDLPDPLKPPIAISCGGVLPSNLRQARNSARLARQSRHDRRRCRTAWRAHGRAPPPAPP